jgi:hypothetical protein
MEYGTTVRPDNASILTSGRAGVVIPVSVIPMHRGDSASGRIDINMQLAEMPRPIENAVIGRGQVWVVPRPALPQFSGLTDYTHAWSGEDITALGQADRSPPSLFNTVATGAIAAAEASEFFTALGLSLQAGQEINTDYIDAYNLVQNFRLAAHSSRMTRYDYYAEDATTSLELKPAFWPRNRMHDIVPDYEQALVVGALDLDITAGSIPIIGLKNVGAAYANAISGEETGGETVTYDYVAGVSPQGIRMKTDSDGVPEVFADLTGGVSMITSLADIDKARTTNAFAKRVAQMAGTDYSGFNNDDVVIAELMQGFVVPDELFNRPWLVDSKTVVFGMVERHATDSGNQDDSITVGSASLSLSFNVPPLNYGGIGIVTVEVMPERLYERQADEYLYVTGTDELPNAMRDIQRTEPVDTVLKRRVDTHHTSPDAEWGYEPMNAKWRRERTTMGGEFRQLVPGTPNETARTAIWQPDVVDPEFTSDHWLCPHPFPQNVFSVTDADIVNISVRQTVVIAGITQFGEALVEDNDEFLTVQAEQV